MVSVLLTLKITVKVCFDISLSVTLTRKQGEFQKFHSVAYIEILYEKNNILLPS